MPHDWAAMQPVETDDELAKREALAEALTTFCNVVRKTRRSSSEDPELLNSAGKLSMEHIIPIYRVSRATWRPQALLVPCSLEVCSCVLHMERTVPHSSRNRCTATLVRQACRAGLWAALLCPVSLTAQQRMQQSADLTLTLSGASRVHCHLTFLRAACSGVRSGAGAVPG